MSYIQVRNNANLVPFIRETGMTAVKQAATFFQDATRAIPLAPFTLLSKIASTGKWTSLTDVDPALVPSNMACGAIGGTLAEFAALSSSSFGIGIDGETVIQVVCDFSGVDSVLDTSGYMTCGALGGTLPEFAAVTTGQFGIGIDGNTAIQVGGLDFSGLDAEDDVPGYYTGGTNGAVIGAGWDAITDGSIAVAVNGVTITLIDLDFSSAVTFDDVADTFNYAFAGRATMLYDWKLNIFRIVSNTTGETSIVGTPATGGAGTDVSAAGYLNMAAAGAAAAGTGGEGTAQTIPDIINAAAVGRFFCFYSGDAMVFVSPTKGEVSAVTDLTAGTAGTDISGAAFLNGLAGVNTAGTGGEGLVESLVDIINAELAGRATCSFDGDKFIFWSPTQGVLSAVSVLTAGTTGTDISGAAYLNGLTGTGTITAGTGGTGANIPAGIYIGPAITAAAIIAADIEEMQILVGNAAIDLDQLVLENSLAITDTITALMITIEDELQRRGIVAQDTLDMAVVENT